MKLWLFLALTAVQLQSYAQESQDSVVVETIADSTELDLRDSIVAIAKSQLGVPYKWATSSPGVSFDCSGFTSFVYSSCDVKASRSSRAYANIGERVELNKCQPGDCLLFAGTQPGSKTIGHIGIVIQNDDQGLKFIHCSSSKKHFGVVITDYHNSGYPKRFLQARRMF